MGERCGGCRFWSEMLAQSNGGAVEAVCLSELSPNRGKYVTERATCAQWKHNMFGAVDCPPNYGEEARRMYEETDGVNP